MPIAAPDVVVALAGTPVSFDVLANDDGTGLAVESWTTPAHGTLVHEGGGTFTYTADAAFAGVDGFSYTVRDGDGATATGSVTISVLAPNRDPQVTDDRTTTTVGTPVDVPVLANDTDPDGDPLELAGIGMPAHGSVSLRPGQAIRYTPQAGFTGTDRFTYVVSDGRGGFAQGTVTVQVGDVQRAPVARDDAFTVTSGTTTVLDPLANDDDPDGDPLRLVGLELPAHGRIAVVDGRLHYTPDAGFEGVDSFRYTVGDGRGGLADARIRVTVLRPNGEPVAVDDVVTTTEGTPVTFDPLANDGDPDGDPLELAGLELPVHGELALGADGTLTYTPDAGFTGEDRFAYTVTDGRGGLATARVTVTVQPASSLEPRFANGYARRRRILLPPQEVDETLSDFRLLVRLEDPALRSVAHGGAVESDQGFDIRFEAEDGTPLAHDLVDYDPTRGRLAAFVRLPSWRTGVQTRIHLYYGKPGLTASEADPATTWQGELAVWNPADGLDRTGQGRDLTPDSVTAETLDGLPVAVFDGGTARAELADASFLAGQTALCVRLVMVPETVMAGSNRYVFLQGRPGSLLGQGGIEFRFDALSGLGVEDNLVVTLRLDSGEVAWFRSEGRQHEVGTPQLCHILWRSGAHLELHRNGRPVPGTPGKLTTASNWSSEPASGATAPVAGEPFSLGIGSRAPADAFAGRLGLVRLSTTLPSATERRLETLNLLEPWRLYGVGPEETADMTDFPPVAADLEANTGAGLHVDIIPGSRAFDPEGGPLRVVAAGTPAHGTAVVLGDRLRYTPRAGFVGTDAFAYTVEDAAGRRATATVHLTVEARDMLEPELPAPIREIPVADRRALEHALAGARPGDHIILEDGSYGGPIEVGALRGTVDRPIVIRARNPLGATITAGLRFQDNDARDVIVWGLRLVGTSWIRGTRITVRRCYIFTEYEPNDNAVAMYVYYGVDCRFDYCHIKLENNAEYEARTGSTWSPPSSHTKYFGIEVRGFAPDPSKSTRNVVFHRCLFEGGLTGGSYYRPSNILLLIADRGHATLDPAWRNTVSAVTRLCRFDTWRNKGPSLYYKASNGLVDRCHVVSKSGSTYISLPRHGFDMRCLDSRFEGGILSIKSGRHVYENTLFKRASLYSGNYPWDAVDLPSSGYWQAAHGCQFYNCRGDIRVGTNTDWPYPASANEIYNLDGTIDLVHQTGTVVSPNVHPDHPVRPPVILDPAEIGPHAPWRGPDG